MKRQILMSLIAAFMVVMGAKAQGNSYNMVIEMTNGTKINIGPNDVKNITFTDGQLTVSGESIDQIKKDISALSEKITANYSNMSNMINTLQARIQSLELEVATLKTKVAEIDNQQGNQGGEQGGDNPGDEQGGDNPGDEQGGDNPGSGNVNNDPTALIGTWYDIRSDYICGVKILADWVYYGEWSKGKEEHYGGTGAPYTVSNGAIVIMASPNHSIELPYTLSDDGKTLTILDGSYRGTYVKQ